MFQAQGRPSLGLLSCCILSVSPSGRAIMNAFIALVSLAILAAAVGGEPTPGKKDKNATKPNFAVSKETTYVTGPLDKEGCVEYAELIGEE